MDTAQDRGIRLIAHGLRFYGPVPAAELLTRLVGLMSEGEAWETIAEAQRIGMIEPVRTAMDNAVPGGVAPEQREWRLVRGYDLGWLNVRPQTCFVSAPAGQQGQS